MTLRGPKPHWIFKQLQQLKGTSPFTISYVVQTCLGGHSIPLSPRALEIIEVLGAISEKERKAGTVPGLERAVPKTKGVEFGSLLHQLAAAAFEQGDQQFVRF